MPLLSRSWSRTTHWVIWFARTSPLTICIILPGRINRHTDKFLQCRKCFLPDTKYLIRCIPISCWRYRRTAQCHRKLSSSRPVQNSLQQYPRSRQSSSGSFPSRWLRGLYQRTHMARLAQVHKAGGRGKTTWTSNCKVGWIYCQIIWTWHIIATM